LKEHSCPETVNLWFLGASSTFELKWLDDLSFLLRRFPEKVKTLRVICTGFVGDQTGKEKIPDPNPPEEGVRKCILSFCLLLCLSGFSVL